MHKMVSESTVPRVPGSSRLCWYLVTKSVNGGGTYSGRTRDWQRMTACVSSFNRADIILTAHSFWPKASVQNVGGRSESDSVSSMCMVEWGMTRINIEPSEGVKRIQEIDAR